MNQHQLLDMTAAAGTTDGSGHRALPQTPMEAALAGVWAYALEREAPVDVDEDFFTAGGESLSAVTLLRSIKEVFGVEISPAGLFEDLNTVRQLAGAVGRELAGVTV